MTAPSSIDTVSTSFQAYVAEQNAIVKYVAQRMRRDKDVTIGEVAEALHLSVRRVHQQGHDADWLDVCTGYGNRSGHAHIERVRDYVLEFTGDMPDIQKVTGGVWVND